MNSKINTSVVLFGILEESSENYRKLSTKSLGVLLVKNGDLYSLPSYSRLLSYSPATDERQ